MRVNQLRLKTSLLVVFAAALCLGQNSAYMLSPDARRVGEKLACLCGVCNNSVSTCTMLGCHYSAPGREKIVAMQKAGSDDKTIIDFFVKREGIRALSSPPAEGFSLLSWVMPFVMILMGLTAIGWWIQRSRKPIPMPELPEGSISKVRESFSGEMAEFEERSKLD